MQGKSAGVKGLVLLPLTHADAENFFDFLELRDVYHRLRLKFSYERRDEIVVDELATESGWMNSASKSDLPLLDGLSFGSIYRDLFGPAVLRSRVVSTLKRVRSAWRLVGQADLEESIRFRMNRMFGLLVMTGRRLLTYTAGAGYSLVAELQRAANHALGVLTLAAPNPPTNRLAAPTLAVEVAA